MRTLKSTTCSSKARSNSEGDNPDMPRGSSWSRTTKAIFPQPKSKLSLRARPQAVTECKLAREVRPFTDLLMLEDWVRLNPTAVRWSLTSEADRRLPERERAASSSSQSMQEASRSLRVLGPSSSISCISGARCSTRESDGGIFSWQIYVKD
jgi:hypothetical protein